MKRNVFLLLLLAWGNGLTLQGQTVEKLADLTFFNQDGVGVGGYVPLDRFTQVESNLWFTTAKGGTFDVGTISRFNLVTHEVLQVASFDNDTGKASESSLLVIGEEAFFTTLNGGSGNRGTIAKVNLNTGEITTLFNFPSDSSMGASPRGGLSRIENDLWCTTSNGGSGGRGTIVKYSLLDGTTTVVANLEGPVLGGQPYDGFLEVGDAWYFTTFTGGSTYGTTGLTLGAGTLSRFTFDTNGEPIFTRVIDLPGGHTQFPASKPVLVGTNSIYFTTVGPNASPGSIVRYDMDSGLWTNVFNFNTNAADVLQFGKQPGYNGLVEWENELYFLTRQGGATGNGIVAKFNIASNTVVKLADLTGVASDSLGNASGSYNTGTIVENQGRPYIYFPVSRGGANSTAGNSSGLGTIIRVALPAAPIVLSASAQGNQLNLAWTGGYPPFEVQTSSNLGDTWQPLAQNLTNRFLAVPSSQSHQFIRVRSAE